MSAILTKLSDWSAIIVRLLTWCAAAAMFSLMTLVFTSVFFRYVLNDPIIATEDIMAILLGVMIFSAVPGVTLSRSHISVELLTGPFKAFPFADRIRLILIDIGVIAMTLYMAARMYDQAVRYEDRETTSLVMEWPLAPYVFGFSFVLVIGAGLFALRAWRDRGNVDSNGGIDL